MPERQERCETCRFWELLPDGHQIDKEEGILAGRCLRFPPPQMDTPLLNKLERDEVSQASFESGSWVWPVTNNNDWCGEWQPIAIEVKAEQP